MKYLLKTSAFVLIAALVACAAKKPLQKPTLFLIGDSTVKNGRDNGANGQWGWGHFLPEFFDLGKINVENHALGGTSTRTFRSKGLWDSVLVKLKAGDYVMMQFGHNDSSPLDDTARARGTIKGNADDSKEIYNPILKKQERVYSYGWYIRQFIREAKAKGATVIVCSLIPRSSWNYANKVNRSEYVEWARAAAIQENAFYINLNKLIADEYDKLGQQKVDALYLVKDHTHTTEAGAKFNAQKVAEGIKSTKGLSLAKYLK
ncbi:hypothetical protein BCY91_11285 [Pelobium manganitolerans]|uniref:SGNH hydrolase-type esterase domain-containing protein n=1 Tax=Pelobium manganitolerans TaxID=1842495 RepID=A0A419S2G9_9SPHI|nr:rhamnogalacturonan acetylesterase [Pelobium manganitolerans]RKD12822.1 hypothetical protein BCY91_11285 [Pelobium manganitolerans]